VGQPGYIGRFAPSPTGRLHIGSVVAAVASWVDARLHGGQWHVRIDDLDPPREVPGAADDILRTLEGLGLTWDGPVVYQSRRNEAYTAALEDLVRRGLAYGCACTRSMWEGAGVYPGTCRDRGVPTAGLVRARLGEGEVQWADRCQGPQVFRVQEALGDVVLRRSDGLWGYHLACVVDDAALGVTDVVRGEDLLSSAASQIRLQTLLQFPTPRYLHVPVVRNPAGQKWSKQTLAPPVELHEAPTVLAQAFAWLELPAVPLAAPCQMLEEVVQRLREGSSGGCFTLVA
jgi:glutamyl-Q tRNA(Asp) synthetase